MRRATSDGIFARARRNLCLAFGKEMAFSLKEIHMSSLLRRERAWRTTLTRTLKQCQSGFPLAE
jgi:hypothetical protein